MTEVGPVIPPARNWPPRTPGAQPGSGRGTATREDGT